MCFGIRISSLFHLNTFNISIQNIKCPKNTKNGCLNIIFSLALTLFPINREALDSIVMTAHAKISVVDRALNILNGYVQSIQMEQARNSDSETREKV